MSHFEELWQCHSCDRILNPDTIGTYRDGPFDDRGSYMDIRQCTLCKSTDVGDFDAPALIAELDRIQFRHVKKGDSIVFNYYNDFVSRMNLEQIQIVLEQEFDL